MIHARIDLVIMGHRRAYEAGPEAMGLWLFAVGYAREQETDGFVPSAILHAAWGGRSNAKLAARLVAAGLIVAVPGGYQVEKYAEKNETKAQINERRAWEARRKAERRGRGSPPHVPAVSQWDTRGTSSGVRDTEPEPEPEPEPKRERERAPEADPKPVDLDQPMPSWALPRVETLRMTLGEPRSPVDVAAEWVGFVAHVAKSRSRGHVVALCEAEWASWLKRTWDFARRDGEEAKARASPAARRGGRGGPQSDETWERDPTGGF